jgi:hypothetical protein
MQISLTHYNSINMFFNHPQINQYQWKLIELQKKKKSWIPSLKLKFPKVKQ